MVRLSPNKGATESRPSQNSWPYLEQHWKAILIQSVSEISAGSNSSEDTSGKPYCMVNPAFYDWSKEDRFV